jgi:hypothetical protein
MQVNLVSAGGDVNAALGPGGPNVYGEFAIRNRVSPGRVGCSCPANQYHALCGSTCSGSALAINIAPLLGALPWGVRSRLLRADGNRYDAGSPCAAAAFSSTLKASIASIR